MDSKNILIIGASSELARRTIEELKNKNYTIYTTSRSVEIVQEGVNNFHLDVSNIEDFLNLRAKFNNIKFDTIINFAGIAIAGAVEELDEIEFKKQLDVNLFSLLRIIKYFCPYLAQDGKLVNISSMASYGIFPFLAPYSISKASADILLNLYSVESRIKTVSIRPGAVATKFWESSIELNKSCLVESSIDSKFQKEKEFLVKNAQKNSLHALNPIYAAKKIAAIIEKKNPKNIYNIGLDSKFAKLSRFLPQELINKIIKLVLKKRIR